MRRMAVSVLFVMAIFGVVFIARGSLWVLIPGGAVLGVAAMTALDRKP